MESIALHSLPRPQTLSGPSSSIMTEQHQWERRSIKGISLLEGEEISLTLNGRDGLGREPSPHGDFLLLTNRRVMRLAQENARERFGIAYLEDIDSVEISTPSRSSGALVTGGLLVLAGILAGILVDAFGFHLLIALTAAGVLVGLGILNSSKYLIPDETATVVFRTGASEMALPLRSRRAISDAYFLVNHLFELRAGQHPHTPPEEVNVPEIQHQPWPQWETAQGETALTVQPDPGPDPSPEMGYENPVEADVAEVKEGGGDDSSPYTGHEEAEHTSDRRSDDESF